VLNEHNFYPMLMLFGPVCVLVGIAGAIDPRVLNQTAIQTNRTRAIARIVLVVLVVAGMGIGWATAHFWYPVCQYRMRQRTTVETSSLQGEKGTTCVRFSRGERR